MTQWINGQWLSGQGESLQKHNPVSGDLLWEGVAANASQVEQACSAARSAFRHGRNAHLLSARLSSKSSRRCLKRIKKP